MHKVLFILLFTASTFSLHARWQAVSPEFDGLNEELEQHYEELPGHGKAAMVERLEESALKSGNPVAGARAHYWKARLLADTRSEYDQALELAQAALAATDSADMGYDWHRYRSLLTSYNITKGVEYLESFRASLADREYFHDLGDSLAEAKVCSNLGQLFFRLESYDRALTYTLQAQELYNSAAGKASALKNSLNSASAYLVNGDFERCDSILRLIEGNESVLADTAFHIKYLQLRTARGQREAAFKAYDLACLYGNERDIARTAGVKARMFEQMQMPDSAIHYYHMGLKNFGNSTYVARQMAYDGLANCYAMLDRPDSVATYTTKAYSFYRDSIMGNNLGSIYKVETLAVIEKYESDLENLEERNVQQRVIFILALSLLAIGVVLMITLYYNHRRITKLKLVAMQNQVEQSERELMSNQIIMTGNDGLLDELMHELAGASKNSANVDNLVQSLSSKIKLHQGTSEQWSLFRERFEKVHPNFISKLREAGPKLTEGELRLCIYLYIGLESKQIAQLLSLQSNSVKIARYRIRKKLNLETGANLEAFLRAL